MVIIYMVLGLFFKTFIGQRIKPDFGLTQL